MLFWVFRSLPYLFNLNNKWQSREKLTKSQDAPRSRGRGSVLPLSSPSLFPLFSLFSSSDLLVICFIIPFFFSIIIYCSSLYSLSLVITHICKFCWCPIVCLRELVQNIWIFFLKQSVHAMSLACSFSSHLPIALYLFLVLFHLHVHIWKALTITCNVRF